jgi:predicted phage terminase large subunit-like protein
MTISPHEYQAFCRQDFYTFMHRAFAELNPRVQFLHNWHNELIAAKLEACRLGNITRLIINVPPRSLKSHAAAVCFPAFLLGHNPSAQIICASYGQDLASKHSLDCRTLMASAWYKSLFPTRLASQKQSVQEFLTTRNGFRLATSVGGVLTGRGADFVIIDDPLKPDEALSETTRKGVNEWYDHTLYSRLNDKRTGCILIIMQRLHEDDLVGHVLEQENWEHIRLPAIAEEEETHLIESALLQNTRTIRRHVGEALHPKREPLATLKGLRRTIGEYNFAGQYQQQPAPLGGGLVKAKWFMTYVPGAQPSRFNTVFQSWDTANKCTELSDFSVCTTWGRKNKKLYLLHVLRKRMDYPDLKRAVRDQAEFFRPSNILIEDKASGTQLIQELIREGVHNVTRYEPTIEKVMRLNSVTSTIENGFVYVPTEADWLACYLHELTSFPNGKHDDQADSTSQALDWAKTAIFSLPLIEYYRNEVLRLGLPLERWMLENWPEMDSGIVSGCPQCKNPGPAQYGRTCHCNQCGYKWNPHEEQIRSVPKHVMENGNVVEWNDRIELWVDLETGATYEAGS